MMQTLRNPPSVNGNESAYKSIAGDIAEALKSPNGTEKAREILDAIDRAHGKVLPFTPLNGLSPQFQFIPAGELKNQPRIEYLANGLLQARGINAIYGAPKEGKSFVVSLISADIAQGLPVLYAAGEGFSGYASRIDALEKAYRRPVGNLTFTRAVNLYDPEVVTAFIEAARPAGYKLIVFDTLAACMVGADENSNQDMQRVIANCQRIVDALDCAVLLVHHTTKGGTQYRGASALFGGVDMMIELVNEDGLITLSCAGSKNSEGFQPRHYRLVPHGESVAAMPSERHLTEGAKVSPLQMKILATLNLEAFRTVGATSKQIRDILDAKQSSLFASLSTLLSKGYIRQAVKGDPYYIEQKGVDALSPLHNHSNQTNESSTTSSQLHSLYSNTPLGVGVERVVESSPIVDIQTMQGQTLEGAN